MTPSLYPKQDFDLDPEITWLMHCAEGPVPRCSIKAIQDFLIKEAQPWKVSFSEDFEQLTMETRQEAARLIGANASDISLTSTTSAGLTLIAQGLEWKNGDEIIIPVGEFPSNIWPWKALESQGVQVRKIPLWEGHRDGVDCLSTLPPEHGTFFEESLIQAMTPKTKVMAVSWVRFQDGIRLDLQSLAKACRKKSVHLVVDGIQGAGTLTPNLKGVSAFATGAHKGLLTPQGSGFLWTSPDFRSQLKPLGSWLSVEDATDFNRANSDTNRKWNQDGTYLEQGVPNQLGCKGFQSSLAYINRFTTQACGHHIQELQKEFLTELELLPAWAQEAQRLSGLLKTNRLGSILSFFMGHAPEKASHLISKGFKQGLFASVREGYLRIALHGWHDSSDIARAVAWMKGN